MKPFEIFDVSDNLDEKLQEIIEGITLDIHSAFDDEKNAGSLVKQCTFTSCSLWLKHFVARFTKLNNPFLPLAVWRPNCLAAD